MMILLNGHSLQAADRFMPEKLAVNLAERTSTATMTIGPEAPVISVDDWLQDETGPAAGIVWRVKTIDEQYDKRTRTVTMEHAVSTLRDRIMFGEVKPSDISGGQQDPTAAQAAAYIISKQSDWTLGGVAYTKSAPYEFNGDDLYSALEIVSGSLPDCIWEYDFSAYPFTIYIRHLDDSLASEMRTDRNIRTLKKTVDRSRMYTRIYPIGKDNLHIDGEYLSKNEAIYGVISKTETDQSQDTKAKLQAWAQERLDRHCEPAVTVTVSGLDLAEATGEDLDSFTIGKMCRIPLPEFSTTITERVVKLSYSDVISDPMSVTVTLANELEDVSTILRRQAAGSGRAGRYGAKKNEEDHAWFVDTTDHVSMVAEAVAGKDGEGGPDWSRVAELTVDGHGIDARVTEAEGEIVTQWSAIEATQSQITLEVGNAVSQMQSSIQQTAEAINASVSAADSQIYAYIRATATNISYALADTEQGLYTYIDNTAEGTRTQIVRDTNKVWIRDSDPQDDPEIRAVKEGDVWVESTLQGTWDGAEGFNWEHDEGYDWTQIQGAKVWTFKNNKWQLAADQTEMVSYSDVVNTVDHYLNIKIKAITNDQGMIEVYLSKLEQTADEIRSEVYRADSAIYSFIRQTATNINIGLGSRPTNVRQKGEPATVQGRNPVNGDIWIDTEDVQCWDDAMDLKWEDETSINWNKLRDDIIKVYKDGEWVVASDGTILADDVDMQFEHDHISLLAHNIDTVNGMARENYAEFKVTASRIDSKVEDRTNQLYSHISQTASEIRAEVSDANNGLRSVISQTASQIRSEVSNSVAGLQSSITQTAESINLNVTNVRSELQANINVQANRIGLVVEGTGTNAKIKAAQVVTAINAQTGTSSVLLSADKIRLDGNVTLSGAMSIQNGSLSISRAVMIGSNTSNLVTINNGTINATLLQVRSSGGIKFVGSQSGEYYDLTTERLKNMIRSVSVSGNVLTLTPWYGDPINFSKATSLSGEWGSGSNKYTVTAKQARSDGQSGTIDVGSISVYPVVNVVSSQGGAYTDVYVATATSGGSGYDNHGSATRLTMAFDTDRYVRLRNPSNQVLAQLFIANQSVTQTASWSNNTYTVAAKRDGTQVTSVSVTPVVRPVVSQGQAYTDIYVATGSGSSSDPYVNHGSAKRLTMAFSGSNVNLKDSNNTVYAQLGMAFSWDHEGKPYGDTSSGTAWTPTSRSITVGGISQWIGIQEYSWSSGKKAVRILKDSWSGTAMAGFDISAPTVTLAGTWNDTNGAYTVTATHAGVTATSSTIYPQVHPIASQGSAYMDVSVATGSSSTGYEDHGYKTRLYLVTSSGSRAVSIRSQNSTSSGTVYAQATVNDGYLSAGNIKKGVTIFGVTGTYEGSSGTITKNDIDIPNSGNAWYPSSYSPMPSADATLNNLGQKIPANNVGYVYFQVDVKGVTKVYRISVDTRG